MARRQGGTLSGFTPLSTPNAPTDLSVSTSIGSATVSFIAPDDTGDGAITSFIVTAIDESTGIASGATGSASPITISPGGGTFKIRAQAVNGFGPGRLTEFLTGQGIFSGAELYAWGANSYGRLGDSTTINRSSPVLIGAITNWSQISAGSYHTGGVTTSGELYVWGRGNSGQIGDNTVANKSSPVQIGALTNWAQVSAGANHCAALKTDGTLWSWGNNSNYGQLGDNTIVNKSSPVQIGALTNWAQVSAGFLRTAAITTSGALYAWGYNTGGQLGDGTTIRRSSPVQIGALTNWAQVATDNSHTASVKTDGTLWTWGLNSGQLGDGTKIARSSPVQVGALTNWAQVAVGGFHTACVKTDNTLWTWGRNIDGQLGIGTRTTDGKSSPVQVGVLADWSQVATGSTQTACVKTDNTLWTWGLNGTGYVGDFGVGQLGINSTISRSSPVQVGASTGWAQVAASLQRTAALLGVI